MTIDTCIISVTLLDAYTRSHKKIQYILEEGMLGQSKLPSRLPPAVLEWERILAMIPLVQTSGAGFSRFG